MTQHTLILKAGTKVNLLALTDHIEGTSRTDSIVNLIVEDCTTLNQPAKSDLLPRSREYTLPSRPGRERLRGTMTINVETGNVFWNWYSCGEVTVHFDRQDLNRQPVTAL